MKDIQQLRDRAVTLQNRLHKISNQFDKGVIRESLAFLSLLIGDLTDGRKEEFVKRLRGMKGLVEWVTGDVESYDERRYERPMYVVFGEEVDMFGDVKPFIEVFQREQAMEADQYWRDMKSCIGSSVLWVTLDAPKG